MIVVQQESGKVNQEVPWKWLIYFEILRFDAVKEFQCCQNSRTTAAVTLMYHAISQAVGRLLSRSLQTWRLQLRNRDPTTIQVTGWIHIGSHRECSCWPSWARHRTFTEGPESLGFLEGHWKNCNAVSSILNTFICFECRWCDESGKAFEEHPALARDPSTPSQIQLFPPRSSLKGFRRKYQRRRVVHHWNPRSHLMRLTGFASPAEQ